MSQNQSLHLRSLGGSYAVVHFPLDTDTSKLGPTSAGLWSLTRSSIEYSLVCDEAQLDRYAGTKHQADLSWKAFYLQGPIPFTTCGIIARLSSALATAGIGCFVVSTFDSDVVMVKSQDVARAITAWNQADILTDPSTP